MMDARRSLVDELANSRPSSVVSGVAQQSGTGNHCVHLLDASGFRLVVGFEERLRLVLEIGLLQGFGESDAAFGWLQFG